MTHVATMMMRALTPPPSTTKKQTKAKVKVVVWAVSTYLQIPTSVLIISLHFTFYVQLPAFFNIVKEEAIKLHSILISLHTRKSISCLAVVKFG